MRLCVCAFVRLCVCAFFAVICSYGKDSVCDGPCAEKCSKGTFTSLLAVVEKNKTNEYGCTKECVCRYSMAIIACLGDRHRTEEAEIDNWFGQLVQHCLE